MTTTESVPSPGSIPSSVPRNGRGAVVTRALHASLGLVAAAGLALVASTGGRLGAAASPLGICLLLGMIFGAVLRHAPAVALRSEPGLRVARSQMLKVGVALLGFRLSIESLAAVGPGPVVAVVVVATSTLVGVRWIAYRLGLSTGLGALVGAGFAICGASAVAAAATVVDSEEEEVTFAAGLAMLFGTVSLLTLPLLAATVGLRAEQLGVWAGASVNDVGQVVATAAAGGPAALEVGVVTKLARVLLLAPLLVLLRTGTHRDHSEAGGNAPRQPLVPWFVAAFLVAGAVRSVGFVPATVVDAAGVSEGAFLSVGLVGIGAAVDLRAVRHLGVGPVLLGGAAWVLVVVTGLGAALVAT